MAGHQFFAPTLLLFFEIRDAAGTRPGRFSRSRRAALIARITSRASLGTNRSKLGVVLDLKQPEGLAVLLKLVETSDVFVHNFRPSVPKRLGIDYERLQAINPRLVYCALTGYGDTGPMKDRAGYDQVLQSMTGICAFQG